MWLEAPKHMKAAWAPISLKSAWTQCQPHMYHAFSALFPRLPVACHQPRTGTSAREVLHHLYCCRDHSLHSWLAVAGMAAVQFRAESAVHQNTGNLGVETMKQGVSTRMVLT